MPHPPVCSQPFLILCSLCSHCPHSAAERCVSCNCSEQTHSTLHPAAPPGCRIRHSSTHRCQSTVWGTRGLQPAGSQGAQTKGCFLRAEINNTTPNLKLCRAINNSLSVRKLGWQHQIASCDKWFYWNFIRPKLSADRKFVWIN